MLAIGYKWEPTPKDLMIFCYDPNRPNQTTQLKLTFGQAHSKLSAEDSTGARLRGFFVNPAAAV